MIRRNSELLSMGRPIPSESLRAITKSSCRQVVIPGFELIDRQTEESP